MTPPRRSPGSALLCFIVSIATIACGSSSSNAPDATGTPADCMARCTQKAQTCGAPADRAAQACASLCPRVTDAAQLSCVEGSRCDELAKAFDKTGTVCGISGGGGSGAGAFGDPCKCQPDSTSGGGDFDCFGTGICTTGLRCIGSRVQGVDHGTCRGPVCCKGTTECAAVLGQQGTCGANQMCSCIGGIECVGTSCTCLGGVPAREGLCYPK